MIIFEAMVNLEWYRTFKAIYQNGNLTRAAEELFVSQPNVSIQLASLESYIGHKLFERLPRKLVPTEYGKLLYTQIVESVENLERVEVEFRKSALKREENISIGSPIEYANNVLLEKLNACGINMNLKFGMARDLIDDLANKGLDFVIATQKIEKEGLVYEPLVEEQFMIVAHSTYDTKELEKHISDNNLEEAEKWLLAQKWITYDNKLSIVRRFWRESFNKRPLIKPHFIIPDINMMMKAVCLNYGICITTDLLVEDYLINQEMKIIWKGDKTACNQVWLAYNPLQVTEKQVENMRRMLGV